MVLPRRCLLLAFLALIATNILAQAHPLLQNAMWVQFEETQVHIAINVSAKEIAVAQNLAPTRADDDPGALLRAAQRHGDYLVDHLSLRANGNAFIGRVLHITPPPALAEPERTWFQYDLEYPFTGPPPRSVTFCQDMLREWPYAAGTPWDVSYVVSIKRPNADSVATGLLLRLQPTEFATGLEAVAAPATPPLAAEGWRTFREYLWHGVMHILTGWDHLLFVSALVIATMNFWEMVKVIAAFTLAHTVTLTLSVFDILRLPSWIVEPIIALSIIFVAVENIAWPRRASSRFRLGVAFGFGLIHGLGFAGGLLDAMEGLPRIGTWIALGAFSLGVEIGHQAVVLPLFGTLAMSRQQWKDGLTRPALRYGSSIISVCGLYYLCVAVHEQFFTH